MLDDLVADGFATTRPLERSLGSRAVRRRRHAPRSRSRRATWTGFPERFAPWEAVASADDVERLARAVVEQRRGAMVVRSRRRTSAGLARSRRRDAHGRRRWSDAVDGKPAERDLDVVGRRGHAERVVAGASRTGADGDPSEPAVDLAAHAAPRSARLRDPHARRLALAVRDVSRPGRRRPGRAGLGSGRRARSTASTSPSRVSSVRRAWQIETEYGPAMLDDWDAESTAWLRWSVAALERLGTVAPTTVQRRTRVRRGRASPRARRRS